MMTHRNEDPPRTSATARSRLLIPTVAAIPLAVAGGPIGCGDDNSDSTTKFSPGDFMVFCAQYELCYEDFGNYYDSVEDCAQYYAAYLNRAAESITVEYGLSSDCTEAFVRLIRSEQSIAESVNNSLSDEERCDPDAYDEAWDEAQAADDEYRAAFADAFEACDCLAREEANEGYDFYCFEFDGYADYD